MRHWPSESGNQIWVVGETERLREDEPTFAYVVAEHLVDVEEHHHAYPRDYARHGD